MLFPTKDLSPLEIASQALEALSFPQTFPEDFTSLSKKAQLQLLLDRKGLGLDAVAENLRFLAFGAEREETRFKANELALRLHEVLKEEKESTPPQIVFQIVGENVNMNFLKPLGA